MNIILRSGDIIKADGETRTIQGFQCTKGTTLVIMKSDEGTFNVEKDAIFRRLEEGSATYNPKETK